MRSKQGSAIKFGLFLFALGFLMIGFIQSSLANNSPTDDFLARPFSSIEQDRIDGEFQAGQPVRLAIPGNVGPEALQLSTTNPQTTTVTDPIETGNPADSGDVVVNEVELVDTVVQWFAWGWICLGIGALLLVLLIIPFLQIRGSHLKRQQEE